MFYTYPGGKQKALTFSYDDGQVFDRKLVEIFNRNGLKATFHLNSGRLDKSGHHGDFVDSEEIAKLYAGHEVACHGVLHQDPLLLSEQELLWEYSKDRLTLEKYSGQFVQGLSYAYGRYNDTTKRVAKAVGLKYSRTVNSTHDFRVPADFLEWNPTCHHADERLMELGRNLIDSPPHRMMPLMYVWGHSYEFNRDDNWGIIEEFCELMKGREDIWYATNIEICNYVNAIRSLEISMDQKRIYNPTATAVWVRNDVGETIVCEPGKITVVKD
ncbi:MAG: polysaccharide deacetylase family protein [Lachnospiraceae bacterium]|nr:polysaccharide deacetylase family protein [Lachnospiraceae bacterium]